ncbi:MAG: DNA polymerase IV, partial [Spirochaetes bacterium]|nr:DNA polymerase IV [Spirochaetota bacterium]
APNRYVAKVASGTMKPAGLVVVEEGGEAEFMSGLRLKDLWGVGPKSRARLEELGVGTMERLLALSRETVESIFGKAGGEFVYEAARGIDPGIYASESRSRSVSSETTYERDVSDVDAIEGTLLGMAEELVARLYADGTISRCVVVKLRYGDFETLSARETRPEPFSGSSDVFEAARGLLSRKWDGRPLRLVGLGLAGLDDGSRVQRSLFEDPGERGARVERAGMDAARRGLGRLTRARLIPKPPGATPRKPS